ncbi:MAG: M28 family metallopeptidase [Bacteroidia bacterium]
MRFVLVAAIVFGLWLEPITTQSQNIEYARQTIKTLTSEDFAGRGYVNNGDAIAADFIKKEFRKFKLQPLGENYFQRFNFPVIAYSEEPDIIADGISLVPGYEVLINPGCPKVNGIFNVIYIDSAIIDNNGLYNKLLKRNLRNCFLVVDDVKNYKLLKSQRAKDILNNTIGAKGLIYLKTEHLMWGVATSWAPFPIIYIKKNKLKYFLQKIQLNISPEYKFHNTQNVLGYVKGTHYPDSFVVFTAHYDHLGMLGNSAVFAGANDNASGVAMMLDLAQTYAKNPPPYSVLFIAFAGEEAGLIGSYFYTLNPIVELSKMSVLINLDLMATGDKGLTAVNGEVFPELFNRLVEINRIYNYLPAVNARGKAQNSDHYHFSEAGVKAFFFYLMGEYNAYHDVHDVYEAVTLSKYNEAFLLIKRFADSAMGIAY